MNDNIINDWRLKNKGRQFEIWHVYRAYKGEERKALVKSFMSKEDAENYAISAKRICSNNVMTVEMGLIFV